jgi:hypothetical protein
LGRGTTLGITDSTFVFDGPGFHTSGPGVRHSRNRVVVLTRSHTLRVIGFGMCPYGPANFMAMDFSFHPFLLLRLADRSAGMID